MTNEEKMIRLIDNIKSAIIFEGATARKQYKKIMDFAKSIDISEEKVEEIMQSVVKSENDSGNECKELWLDVEPIESGTRINHPFPIDYLPKDLKDYLKAVSDYVQVAPDMGALSLLSVLSLCLQGKAVVKHPGNNHTESLNLYTITVAESGGRKSGCFKEFIKPVNKYIKNYNKTHAFEIASYQNQKRYWENQRQMALSGKNADLQKADDATKRILALNKMAELELNVNDITPEALAYSMEMQGEKMGVLDDEGTVFDVLSGIYSGGTTNIGLFLKAYDGSEYNVSRRGRESIKLKNPLLTIGLMTQKEHFAEAMNNKQFIDRGFIQRFCFSFPEDFGGNRKFHSNSIPQELEAKFTDLVYRLLDMKQPETEQGQYVLNFDKQATLLFQDFFYDTEDKIKQLKKANDNVHLIEWFSKQFSRGLRIAGILHLAEHEPTELIDALTAQRAVIISMWIEDMARIAFGGEFTKSDEVKNAEYVLKRIKDSKEISITKSKMYRKCQNKLKADELDLALELLEDKHYIRINRSKSSIGDKPTITINVNPQLYE